MGTIERSEASDLLHEERIRLEQIRSSLAQDPIQGRSEADALGELSFSDEHPADLGTETFERQKEMSILTNIQSQLLDVDLALERVERGTYGICEACGAEIDQDRLRARPATRFCLNDQARAERGVA